MQQPSLFAYSYVDTVHSSQGQTADYCIYSPANAKSMTIGRESFYVAASRARQEFVVYTANTQDLGVTVQISRANENAFDLVDSVSMNRVRCGSRGAGEQVVQNITAPLPDKISEKSQPSLVSKEQESSHSSNEPDERSGRNEPESNQRRSGLDKIIDSLTNSSRRAGELATDLQRTSIQAETARTEQSELNRAAEKSGNNITESNRAAAELTRELQELEQRAVGSDIKNRKIRKPERASHSQHIEKNQQSAKDIGTDSQNNLPRQVRSEQHLVRSNDNQTPRTAQGKRDYATDYHTGDLGTQPYKSSQQKNTARNQGQSQQQRNPSQTYRGEILETDMVVPTELSVEMSGVAGSEIKQSAPKNIVEQVEELLSSSALQPLSLDEVNQISLTALSAINRYGKKEDSKTIFKNKHYQIEKFPVNKTYGESSYLTIDARDGRGRLLTLLGQNFNPDNLKVQENHLTPKDVSTFEKIQSALDYLQQVRQFKENAQIILFRHGKRDWQQSIKGYRRILEGDKYRIERDDETFRIIAKDGRGEILNYPSSPNARYPETQARAKFNQEDVELFSTIVQQIEQKRREAERTRLLEQSQQRKRGRGLSR